MSKYLLKSVKYICIHFNNKYYYFLNKVLSEKLMIVT